MFTLNMEHLENCFKRAVETNAKYVGVAICVPNANEKEIIINPHNNFEAKLEYYKKTYDNELSHNAVGDTLKLVGFTFGNSFAEIEEQLLK